MEREEIHRSNDPKEGIEIMQEWKKKMIQIANKIGPYVVNS